MCLFRNIHTQLFVTKLSVLATDDETECVEKELKTRTVRKLKGKYAAVVDKLAHIIESKRLNINSLILKLCQLDENNTTIFSTDCAFREIHSVTKLFHCIGQYCSIYDYELLYSFIESTECEEAIKLLDNFTKEISTSILSDLDLLAEDGELRYTKGFISGTHKLSIKYVGDKCTLKIKEMVQNIVCKCLKLKKGSIIFRGVEEGCVAFVYQISPAVKSYLLQYPLTADHVALFRKYQIKCFIIDDEEFEMPMQSKVVIITHVIMHVCMLVFKLYGKSDMNCYMYH